MCSNQFGVSECLLYSQHSARLFGVLEVNETVLTFRELTSKQPDIIQSEMQHKS